MSCLFCKIIAREIPSEIVYEDAHSLAFKDINPQAPHHILVIPKEHHPNLKGMDITLMGHLFNAVNKVVCEQNLDDSYRLVVNKGEKAGQSVFHLHVHILSGRSLSWPPG